MSKHKANKRLKNLMRLLTSINETDESAVNTFRPALTTLIQFHVDNDVDITGIYETIEDFASDA